jgi:hypothetical protein
MTEINEVTIYPVTTPKLALVARDLLASAREKNGMVQVLLNGIALTVERDEDHDSLVGRMERAFARSSGS